jgi:CRP/FNR family nitrogen fixation transcriptional regulator
MTLAYPFEDTRAAIRSTSLADVLDRLGVRMSFAKDEEVYAQEEDADLIYRVVCGVVRTTRLLADGRRQVGDFYVAGDLFGLEVGALHRYSAEALCDCTIQVVKRSSLRAQADEGELDRAIWEATCRDLERAQDHVLLLGRKTACEKVATFLMDLAQRVEEESVDLPMGRQDIADYLGLTIETVSRMLTQLQSSKVVEFASCRQFRVRKWEVLERLAA